MKTPAGLHSTDESIRKEAILALAEAPCRENLSLLLGIAEHDPAVEVRYFARKALHIVKQNIPLPITPVQTTAEFNPLEASTHLSGSQEERLGFIQQAIDHGDETLVPVIIDHLRTETDPEVHSAALLLLGKLGDERNVVDLLPWLEHPLPRIRANAIDALELIGCTRVYAHIMPCLQDPDNRVRGNAVRAVSSLHQISKRKLILDMIRSGLTSMQATAAWIIRDSAPVDYIEHLIPLLNSLDSTVRRNVIQTLTVWSGQGDPKAREILSTLNLDEAQPGLLAELIAEISGNQQELETLKTQLQSGTPDQRIQAIERAVDTGLSGCSPLLAARLNLEDDPRVLAVLLISLGRMEKTEFLPLLKQFLNHPDDRCRANAVEAIHLIGGNDDLPMLLPRLQDNNNRVRANAVLALAGTQITDIRSALNTMVQDPDEMMQRSALYTIMELDDPSLITLLSELEESPHESVRRNARENRLFLHRIGMRDPAERVTRQFRLYLSCGPGTEVEQELLKTEILPVVAEQARQAGYRFLVVDLAGDPSMVDHPCNTEDVLREIERCQSLSPRLNFLFLAGSNWGRIVLPMQISTREFQRIRQGARRAVKDGLLPRQTLDELQQWYQPEPNTAPPLVILQTETLDENPEMMDRLVFIMATAVHASSLAEERKNALLLSRSALERWYGMHRLRTPMRHVIGYQRTSASDDNIEPFGLLRLRAEAEAWNRFPPSRLLQTSPESGNFVTDLRARLLAAISDRLQDDQDLRHVRAETFNHHDFANRAGMKLVGRDEILEAIHTFACLTPLPAPDDFHRENPLWLTGPEGVGKTALLSRVTLECRIRQANHDPGVIVIPRFIGTTPSSRRVRTLLEEICREIAERCGLSHLRIPPDLPGLQNCLLSLLQATRTHRSLLLILDGLDELEDEGSRLDWLPLSLPPHVRLIVSATAGSPASLILQDLLQDCPGNHLDCPPLTPGSSQRMMEQLLQTSGRSLQKDQFDALFSHCEGANLPLRLVLLHDEVRHWSGRDDRALHGLPDTVGELITQQITQLAGNPEFGYPLLTAVLGFLLAARNGLTEDEILELVNQFLAGPPGGQDAKRRNHPPVSFLRWSRLHQKLSPLLLERSADDFLLLTFSHRIIRQQIAALDFVVEGMPGLHRCLADRFLAEPLEWQTATGENLPNRRKISELPWQLAACQDWNGLLDCLTDARFMAARCDAGMTFELADDLEDAARRIPDNHPRRHHLILLAELFRDDVHTIARHPETLSQCLWNRGWWTDGSGSEAHLQRFNRRWFDFITTGVRRLRLKPFSRQVEEWQDQLQSRRDIPWLRALQPPPIHLGSSQRVTITGHENIVRSAVFLPDGRRLASVSVDGTARVWNAADGSELARLEGHEGIVDAVAVSPNGRWLSTGCWDGRVRLYDLRSFTLTTVFTGHEAAVTEVLFGPDSRTVFSASSDGSIRRWNIVTGQQEQRWLGHTEHVSCLALSPDGRFLASGSKDRTIRVIDLDKREPLRIIDGHPDTVSSLSFAPDGILVSGCWDGKVRIYTKTETRAANGWTGHDGAVHSVAFSPDGEWIVSGGHDATIRLWLRESGTVLRLFRGHLYSVENVNFSPLGDRIVSCSRDRTLRVWDLRLVEDDVERIGHQAMITAIAATKDGRVAVSASEDRTIRAWSTETGRHLALLSGHEGIIQNIAVDHLGRQIASVADDGSVRIWDLKQGQEVRKIPIKEGRAVCLTADPQYPLIVATGGENPSLQMISNEPGHPPRRLPLQGGTIQTLTVSDDGSTVAAGTDQGRILIINTASGSPRTLPGESTSAVEELRFSRDGLRLAAYYRDGTTREWRLKDNQEIRVIVGHPDLASLLDPYLYPVRAVIHNGRLTVSDPISGVEIASIAADAAEVLAIPAVPPRFLIRLRDSRFMQIYILENR